MYIIIFDSLGWNAFFWQLKNKNHDWDCTDTKAISTYFEESCVLGIDTEATKLPKNLHSLCRKEGISQAFTALVCRQPI